MSSSLFSSSISIFSISMFSFVNGSSFIILSSFIYIKYSTFSIAFSNRSNIFPILCPVYSCKDSTVKDLFKSSCVLPSDITFLSKIITFLDFLISKSFANIVLIFQSRFNQSCNGIFCFIVIVV